MRPLNAMDYLIYYGLDVFVGCWQLIEWLLKSGLA